MGEKSNGLTVEQLEARNAELERENRVLRTALDDLPDTIYVKDKTCRFLFANEAVVRRMGKAGLDELIGRNDFDFYPEDLARKYYDAEQAFFDSGDELLNLEQPRLDTVTGEKGWMFTSKMVFRDDAGEVTGLVGIGRDVTALKRAQDSLQEQLEIIWSQRMVLEEVSTPIIPIMDHIIVMPLIGVIDTARSRSIMRTLLAGITQHRARIVILDITGVPLVDTGVADHLNRTIQAARLKGTTTIITGISDAVAEVIVDLGIDWSGIDTVRDLQSGLKIALRRLRERLDE